MVFSYVERLRYYVERNALLAAELANRSGQSVANLLPLELDETLYVNQVFDAEMRTMPKIFAKRAKNTLWGALELSSPAQCC